MKEEKNRHTVWLTDDAWELVEERHQKDNCSTKNEYIEKAIRFYSGYLDSERAEEYLPRVLAQVLEGKLDAFGETDWPPDVQTGGGRKPDGKSGGILF